MSIHNSENNDIKKTKMPASAKLVVILSFLFIYIISVESIYDYKVNKIAEKSFTKYELSYGDLWYLLLNFDIYIPELDMPGVTNFYISNKYNKDKDKFILICGAGTEEVVQKLNENLLSCGMGEKYGFNDSNPITGTWISTHPKDFIDLMDKFEDDYYSAYSEWWDWLDYYKYVEGNVFDGKTLRF